MRVGIGYDVHRFDGRRPLKLGGVIIPFARGLGGYSDADVLLHAIADALFGALGAPDIGEQFPSSDPRYRGIDSRVFVQTACEEMRRRGWSVENIDATVIADAPKLIGYKPRIARAISRLLDVAPQQVSVKAKTTEGFAPGKSGIAAQAIVLLKPSPRPFAFGSPSPSLGTPQRGSRSRRLRGGTPSPTRRRRVPGLGWPQASRPVALPSPTRLRQVPGLGRRRRTVLKRVKK